MKSIFVIKNPVANVPKVYTAKTAFSLESNTAAAIMGGSFRTVIVIIVVVAAIKFISLLKR
jgi:hypothetical protein